MAVEIDTIVLSGLASARPAAANALMFYATDTKVLSLSDGATWTDFFTAAGRALLDDADAAAQRATLDLEPGTDVPALAHSHAGTTNGSKLAQANTHESPDTDSGTSSLHHTIGSGANQAAAGNHSHAGGGAELDYVQFTSGVSVTGTSEGAADTVVTGGSVSYDGSTEIIIEFFSPGVAIQATAGAFVGILLYDGGTVLGLIAQPRTPAANNNIYPVLARRKLTPSAGSHQFIIKATTSSGTSTVNGGSGGSGQYLPGYIRITRA